MKMRDQSEESMEDKKISSRKRSKDIVVNDETLNINSDNNRGSANPLIDKFVEESIQL
mgnify:CR=1 FL=1